MPANESGAAALRECAVTAFSWPALVGRLVEVYRDAQNGFAARH